MHFDSEISSVQQALKKYIRSKIYCPYHAEDILQEVNSILVKKQNNFDKSKNFSGWAFAIARFQIKKFFSNTKRNREDCADFNFDNINYASDCSSPSQNLLNKEESKSIEDKISFFLENKISDREKTFFKYIKNGLSRSDIMNEMDLKQGNYYAYRMRISQKFKIFVCEV